MAASDSASSSLTVVCFDLGGVLIRLCRSWAEVVEAAGLSCRAVPGVGEDELRARRHTLMNAHQSGNIEANSYYQLMSEAFESVYSPVEMERVHHAWLRGDYPRALSVIERLNAIASVNTACLSNTNDAHWTRLLDGAEFESPAALQHRLASHELGVMKPHPRIYGLAREHFGVPAESILFFDDLPENVEAARIDGWRAECVDPLADPVGQCERFLESWGIL
jgi:putative hydrolase of the HAD superfamily